MYEAEFEIQLNENVEATVVVYFNAQAGIPGTRWEPPEGPEFEVTDFEVLNLKGDNWEKNAEELHESDWYYLVHDIVYPFIFDNLYLDEYLLDAYYGAV